MNCSDLFVASLAVGSGWYLSLKLLLIWFLMLPPARNPVGPLFSGVR